MKPILSADTAVEEMVKCEGRRREKNMLGSHFNESGFKGGSSAASWMLGITLNDMDLRIFRRKW